MLTLSRTAARSLLLSAQRLLQPPAPAAKDDVLAAIRRMCSLQIDTISVVARSQHLVLWSRLGSYDPLWLAELLVEGSLFEYWSRAMCLLPIEDFPLYRWRMLERAQSSLYIERLPAALQTDPDRQRYMEAVEQVLERIRSRGSVRSIEFTDGEKRNGGWWNRKPQKVALDHLFETGILMIARRESMQRVYDLRERVLPEWDDSRALSVEASWRELILRRVRALGIAFPRWIRRYYHDLFRGRRFGKEAPSILESLVEEGEILPVSIEALSGMAYVHRDNCHLLDRAATGALQSTFTTLLSPFDPIVFDRDRAKELFDFEYKIEVYTPEAQRRYGYFTLPILHRGALVGRLDPKAHRKDGLMEIKAVYIEPGVLITDDLVTSLARTLREFGAWHGTPEVVIRRSDPAPLQEALSSALNS